MPTDPKTLAQVAAAANAADRANRPTHLVTFGAIVLVAGVLFALYAFNALRSSKVELQAAAQQAALIERNIGIYNSLETEEQSLASFYPPNPYIDSTIAKVSEPFEDELRSDINIAPSPERRTVVGITGLERYTLRCSFNNEPVDVVTRWITDALKTEEHLKDRIFVSRVALTPVNPEWRTQVSFAWYVAR